MVYKRLLTSLASHASKTPSTSRLVPPYSYTAASIIDQPSSLRPPYSHRLPFPTHEMTGTGTGRSLRSSQRYSIISNPEDQQVGSPLEIWLTWAKGLLGSQEGRNQLLKQWEQSVSALETIKTTGTDIQQIPFHALSSHLSQTADEIRANGVVIVRDVVPDHEAIEWARQVLKTINERDGRPVFWPQALLEARSNPSVLSANKQVMHALTGIDQVYIHADSIYEGLGESIGGTFNVGNIWQPAETPAHTPLLSHLTLTPTLPNIPTLLSPSSHAATYSLLRPFFRPTRSRISFYSASEYLDPSNWTIVDLADLVAHGEGAGVVDLPHLQGTEVTLPLLAPGDMILRHASLPIHSTPGSGQVFLPLSPVPKENNEQWVQVQRNRFEQGLPPVGAIVGEGLVLTEERGSRDQLGGRAGREAMGYE